MKIEKKAKQIAVKYAPDLNHAQQYMESGFKLGAKWMLEEVLYWLKDHASDYAITAETESGLTYPTIDFDLFTDFEKAMKK